jgi:hypothetical protein
LDLRTVVQIPSHLTLPFTQSKRYRSSVYRDPSVMDLDITVHNLNRIQYTWVSVSGLSTMSSQYLNFFLFLVAHLRWGHLSKDIVRSTGWTTAPPQPFQTAARLNGLQVVILVSSGNVISQSQQQQLQQQHLRQQQQLQQQQQHPLDMRPKLGEELPWVLSALQDCWLQFTK